jgi:hypothetical protein
MEVEVEASRRVVPLPGVNLIYITYLGSVVEYIFPASKDHAGVWFLRYRLFTSPWRVFGVEH